MRRVYCNLGQMTGRRMCYIRSTDVEAGNWHKLLWSVPDEMLYFLSRGDAILILDKSTHTVGKIERIFLPVFEDVLRLILFGQKMQNKQYQHHFFKAMEALKEDKALNRKYSFWKGKIVTPPRIDVLTQHVVKEPNILYKRKTYNGSEFSSNIKKYNSISIDGHCQENAGSAASGESV